MKRVAILTPVFSRGDAIGNDVIGMYNLLQSIGQKPVIITETSYASGFDMMHIDHIDDFLKSSGDIMIYHFSVGWEKGMKALQKYDCTKIIKYHNITPYDFFYDFSKDHFYNCKYGFESIKDIIEIDADLYISDSIYNMHELCLWGADKERSMVIHPFNNIGHLKIIEPDSQVIDRYLDGLLNIITVGRVVPNKGFDHLLDIFSLYQNEYNNDSRLIIIGERHGFLSEYMKYIDKKIQRLGIDGEVVFTGKVTDEQLKAYFLCAKTFVLTSHHEGFCVPLVEAMAFKVPSVVYLNAAVAHTVGDAAIGWEDLDPRYFAESIDKIAQDDELYHFLCTLGSERYVNIFSNDAISQIFFEVFKKWI